MQKSNAYFTKNCRCFFDIKTFNILNVLIQNIFFAIFFVLISNFKCVFLTLITSTLIYKFNIYY